MTNPFEELKELTNAVLRRLDAIERIILDQIPQGNDELLTVDQSAAMLDLSKSTIYRMTSENRIPHLKLGNGRVYFKRDSILDYLNQNQAA